MERNKSSSLLGYILDLLLVRGVSYSVPPSNAKLSLFTILINVISFPIIHCLTMLYLCNIYGAYLLPYATFSAFLLI